MLLLLAHLSAAAELTIFTQTPAAVSVDGQLMEYDEASLLLVARNLKGGKHTVKIESIGRKPITQLDVTLAQTERVDLYYSQRTLSKVATGLVGEPAVTLLPAQVPSLDDGSRADIKVDGRGGRGSSTTTTTTATTGVVVSEGGATTSVQMGAGTGGVSVVIVDGTSNDKGKDRHHDRRDPPPPPPVVVVEPPKPEPVQVVFSLKDSFDMSNVYVDGQRVVEFRTGDKSKTVTLMSGIHTVEIKSFTEFDTWFKGTLLVTPGEPMKVGFAEDEAFEVYNRPAGAWTPK